MHRRWRGVALAGILAALAGAEHSVGQAAQAQSKAPAFEVDPMWPKMPKQWILGQVSGLDVDAQRSRVDHPASLVAQRRREGEESGSGVLHGRRRR